MPSAGDDNRLVAAGLLARLFGLFGRWFTQMQIRCVGNQGMPAGWFTLLMIDAATLVSSCVLSFHDWPDEWTLKRRGGG